MKKTLYILDYIAPKGYGGVSLNLVQEQLKGIKETDELEVILNSPGGEVFEGIAIFNYLRAYKPTVRITGLAGSIASIIALAGKKIIMHPGAMYFVHEPWSIAIGDEHEMKKRSEHLGSIKASIVEAYQTRMNKSEEEILEWLKEDKYLTGKQSQEIGLADEIKAPAQDADYSYASLMKFAAALNSEKFENIINNKNEVPKMDLQEKVNSLQAEVNSKDSEINNLKNKYSELETKNQKLEDDLKASRQEVIQAKYDAYATEESTFVQSLIDSKKVQANQKDFLVKDLIDKRLEDENAYSAMRDFLAAKEQNPLTKTQATQSKAGEKDESKFSTADFNNKEKDDVILKHANKRAKAEGITLAEAIEQIYSELETEEVE